MIGGTTANLHKCQRCDCNATGVFRHCKFCRVRLSKQGLCGQCATKEPQGKSMYCLDCQHELNSYMSNCRDNHERQRIIYYKWLQDQKKIDKNMDDVLG